MRRVAFSISQRFRRRVCQRTLGITRPGFSVTWKRSCRGSGACRRRALRLAYLSLSDISTTPTHSSNDPAGQLLSTRRERSSYGCGVPPNQLNQPWPGTRTRGTSNSLITNSVPAGKSERSGSRDLSLMLVLRDAGEQIKGQGCRAGAQDSRPRESMDGPASPAADSQAAARTSRLRGTASPSLACDLLSTRHSKTKPRQRNSLPGLRLT